MSLPVDALAALQMVTRGVERCERDGEPAWRLRATREYETDIDDLWDALTNAERIPRWFLPVSGDLRPGGRYALEQNASGQILVCEAPRRLGITWEYGGQVSWVDVALTAESEERTMLVLEHVAHVPPEMWDQFGPGAVGVGWDQALLGLTAHLAGGGAAVDPEAALAWQQSEEGRRFAAECSDAWASASIAAGTDEQAAREAAARTTAFYTGEG